MSMLGPSPANATVRQTARQLQRVLEHHGVVSRQSAPDEGTSGSGSRSRWASALDARSELPPPENGPGAMLASPYYHCGPIDIITHPLNHELR